MVDKALMNYVLLPRRMLGRLLDVKVWRGEGCGLSDHFLVEARLIVLGGWRSAGRMEGVRNILKVSELNHSDKEMAYQENLHVKYKVCRDGEVESVEKCGGSVRFTTAIPGDSTNGGSPVRVANANNYTDTGVLSQYLQLPVHSVGNEI